MDTIDAAPAALPGTDAFRAIAEGAIRQQLGLEVEDLRVGLDVAATLIRRGDLHGALNVYVGLVLCNPLDTDYQVGLANCALLVGEPALALQAASGILASSPQDPRAWLLSGRACIELAAYKEAAEDLAEAVRRATTARRADLAQQASVLLDLANRLQEPTAP